MIDALGKRVVIYVYLATTTSYTIVNIICRLSYKTLKFPSVFLAQSDPRGSVLPYFFGLLIQLAMLMLTG